MLKNDFMLNQSLENDHCYIDLRPYGRYIYDTTYVIPSFKDKLNA